MPYAVIMEIQIGLVVAGRAGKTAAGQIGKQRMGLWRGSFPVLKSCSFIFPPTKKTGYAYSIFNSVKIIQIGRIKNM
jgi:hypothetical protein